VHRNEKRRPGHSKVNEIRRMKNHQKRDPDNEAKRGVSGVQSSRKSREGVFERLTYFSV